MFFSAYLKYELIIIDAFLSHGTSCVRKQTKIAPTHYCFSDTEKVIIHILKKSHLIIFSTKKEEVLSESHKMKTSTKIAWNVLWDQIQNFQKHETHIKRGNLTQSFVTDMVNLFYIQKKNLSYKF